jgi:hypothetical protein
MASQPKVFFQELIKVIKKVTNIIVSAVIHFFRPNQQQTYEKSHYLE